MMNEEKEQKTPDVTTMEAAVARLCRPTRFHVAPHPDPITPIQYTMVTESWTDKERRVYARVHFARMAAYLLHELDNEEACEFAFFLARYHGNAPRILCKLPDVDPTPEELARAKLTEEDLTVIGAEGPVLTQLMIAASRYVKVLFGLRTHPPEVTTEPHVRYHILHKDVLRFRAGFAHAVAVWLYQNKPWPNPRSAYSVVTMETYTVQRYFRYLDRYMGIESLVHFLEKPFTEMGSDKHYGFYGRLQSSEDRNSELLKRQPETTYVPRTRPLHLPPCLARILKRVQNNEPFSRTDVLWVLTRQYPEVLDTIADPTRRAAESRIAAEAIAATDKANAAAAKDPKQFKRKDYSCNYLWAIKLCPLQWTYAIEELPAFQRIKAGNVATANTILKECAKGVNVASHCAKLCATRTKYVNNPRSAIYYTS
jgi:hypothetical protein